MLGFYPGHWKNPALQTQPSRREFVHDPQFCTKSRLEQNHLLFGYLALAPFFRQPAVRNLCARCGDFAMRSFGVCSGNFGGPLFLTVACDLLAGVGGSCCPIGALLPDEHGKAGFKCALFICA